MDDSIMDDSVFDVDGDSDAFSPEPKPKAKAAPTKAAPKKSAPAATKTKAAPKKTTQTTLKPASKKRAKSYSDEENSDVDMISANDDSLLSNTPPSSKKQKTGPGPKKSSGKVLQPVVNESYGKDGTEDVKPKKSSGSGEQYQKISQVDHILKRPDTYIGSVERTERQLWVFNSDTESMELREVSYVPGLYKIFDEVIVNAADNKQRDKNMNEIKVTVDREKGEISVRNNGRGIPIEMHATEKIWIPEMIFGHLLTSSNYDDDQQKVTGGRNGFGAKLCNIYSLEFTLETVDMKSKQKYKQTWKDNMSKMGKASITSMSKGDDYTKVTFRPDFSKFGMEGMDADFEALVKRRVYDMAGTCKEVKVYLNGDRINVRNFKKYMEMYTKAIKTENLVGEESAKPETQVILTDNPHERWEIGFAVSDGSFQQVSFVNSIATTTGGTHVNYIADQIVNKLMEIVKKRNKGGVTLKNNQIRNHIFLFVNCLIVNPAFTSQTKEQLTTKSTQFGSKCTVSEKFLKDIAKTEAVNNILHFAQQKADQVMKKTDGNRRTRMNNSKLTDANKAGTRDGHRCTLILTEGDSASLLALAGRAVVNPDLIGVFPLRGKLLNVRDATFDVVSKNAEIANIKKFMGLQHKKVYTDTQSLRYGSLMIMTDQDHDGSHIKGLLINFFEVAFPSLLKIPGFLKEFITPIVKVWKGDVKDPKKLQSFFTMPEYEAWKELPGNGKGWDHKYFKGLGTSEPSKDGQLYFRDLDRHLKEFAVMQDHEPELLDLAFSKKKADARKEWLRQFRPGTFLDMSTPEISYDDFINKELILFSMADNMRSIPSVIDGFKPGQRKVLYTCFRRNLKKDTKVVDLAGSVSGLTAYAYGETSMQQTIVGLAQTFVGSNNINCLEPSGNFGSRLQGGKDAASARYIYTRLSPFARKVFNVADEPLLTYNLDDGKTIEPEIYVPIVPMILINGADGIGTGWSSSIPNYNPEDIVANLKRRIHGSKDDMLPMKPWFRGWNGEAEDIGSDRFKFSGTVHQTKDNEVEITELPVRMWTQDFKDQLEDIIKAEKTPSFIKDYTEYNTPSNVHFIIKLEDKHIKTSVEKGLLETFKLSKTMATTNLVAFDRHGRIQKYATVLDIMEEFYQVRLRFYQKRKEYLANQMNMELEKMNNQARFIKMIIDNELVVSRKKKTVLVAELKRLGFKAFPKIADARKEGEDEDVVAEDDADENEEDVVSGARDYDYLLGMAIWSLTQERIDKLKKHIGDKELELKKLFDTSPQQIWETDLDDFLNEWLFQLNDEARRTKKYASLGRRESKKLGIGGKAGSRKGKAGRDPDDSDYEFATKTKAAPKKAVSNSLTSYLSQDTKPPKPQPSSRALINALEQAPVSKPPAEEQGLILDGASDPIIPPPDDEIIPAAKIKTSAVTKPTASRGGRTAKKKIVLSEDEDEDDDDVYTAIANEARTQAQPKAGPSRQARTATKKPIIYDDSENDSDNGDDLLGDVSNMVKGISGTTSTTATSKPLFSATASGSRPGSSRGPVTGVKPSKTFVDLSDAETDYDKLMPRGSPAKPPARNAREAREARLFDDEEDSFDMTAPRAALKTATTKAPAVKTKPVEKAKKPAAPSTLKDKAAPILSPAAKAYAAKKAKSQTASTIVPAQPKFAAKPTAASKRKKVVESDEDDLDDIANDILSGVSEDDLAVPKGRPTAAAKLDARPSRRAAATKAKSKYVVDDDDEDEDEDAEEPSAISIDDFIDDDSD